MTKGKVILLIFGFVALIVGGSVGITSRAMYRERQVLEKEGVTVHGKIVEQDTQKRRRSTIRRFTVAYTPAGQAEIQRSFVVSPAMWNAHVTGTDLTSPEIEVRHLPAEPKRAFLVGSPGAGPEDEYVGYGVGGVGLVLLGFAFRGKEREPVVAR